MTDQKLKSVQDLLAEFSDLSLSDFRDAFQNLMSDHSPAVDRYLVGELKNFRGNRAMRAVIAHALAEREDEAFLEDFALIIEKETDVSLCKECIAGLVRIGTSAAIQKLDFLSKSKPNATIASLLRKEIDKIRHEEKEPVTYYLDNLAKGNESGRLCIHAAKVLIKIGDSKVVDTIVASFHDYDEMARSEGAKVLSQLGEDRHLSMTLDLLDQYSKVYKNSAIFVDRLESLEKQSKDERIALLLGHLESIQPDDKTLFERLKSHVLAGEIDAGTKVEEQMLEGDPPLGSAYYMRCVLLYQDNKVAHASKYHDETLRSARVRHTRLRHLLAELSYGIGKIAGNHEEEDDLRARAADWLTLLVKSKDADITKMALFGTAFFVKPSDTALLDATLESHHLDGMTRLLRALERKSSLFTDFFLRVALEHEILDIQEMAMNALSNTEEVFRKVRELLENEKPDIKRTAIRIIGEIKAEPFYNDLTNLLEGQSDIIRVQAIASLGKLGDTRALKAIENVMFDAKSPLLIEAGLEGIALIGGQESVDLLQQFIERTRNKKNAISAVRHLVGSFKSWNQPLPGELGELTLTHLKVWFAEREEDIRLQAYGIAGQIISADAELYNTLKTLFKEAVSRLRAMPSWDKSEMDLVDTTVRTINRNYFFLKDMIEFQKELDARCRNHDHESSSLRVGVFEKLVGILEGTRFPLNESNTQNLIAVVATGLELAGAVWREQDLLYKIAGLAELTQLKDLLGERIKTVPKQAKANLYEALSCLGLSFEEINMMTSIKKILVLEGSAFYRKRVCRFLSTEGYEVRDTDDVEMGYAMTKSDKPDLIITEITFSEPYEGADFAEKVFAEYKDQIQFIFSTNLRESAIIERVSKVGPKKIFFKPYPLEDLVSVIKG